MQSRFDDITVLSLVFITFTNAFNYDALSNVSLGGNTTLNFYISNREAKPCEHEYKIVNCQTEYKSVYRSQDAKLVGEFKKCPSDKVVSFQWYIDNDLQTSVFSPVFNIKPFSLNPGNYTFTSYVKAPGYIASKNKCVVQIQLIKVIAIISYGSLRTVPEGSEFTVSGEHSKDLNQPSGQAELRFLWRYNSTKTEKLEPVDQKGVSFNVPAKKVLADARFYITLKVSTPWKELWRFANQEVVVSSAAPAIHIVCIKNCIDISTPKQDIRFQVICEKFCSNAEMTWKIVELPKLDYNKDTTTGNKGSYFSVKENVFESGKKFTIQVTATNNQSENSSTAEHILKIAENVNLKSCKLEPNRGEAAKTSFRIKNCNLQKARDVKAEAVFVKRVKEKILDFEDSVEDLEFMIPSEGELYVKVTDIKGFVFKERLSFELDRVQDKPPNEVPSVVGDLYYGSPNSTKPSAKEQMKDQNYDEALKTLVVVTEVLEMHPDMDTTIAKKIKQDIVADLGKIPIETKPQLKQEANILENLISIKLNTSSSDLALDTSKLCKHLAEKHLEFIKTENEQTKVDPEVKETISDLMLCSIGENEPNYQSVHGENIDVQLPTYDFVTHEPVPVEDYPDYLDEENAIRNLNKFKEATENYMEICELNTQTLSYAMEVGDKTNSVTSKNCTTYVVTDVLSEERIFFKNIVIYFSKDFANMVNTLFICTTRENPFWWQDDWTILTSVVSIKIKNFLKVSLKNPMTFTLDIVSPIVVDLDMIHEQTSECSDRIVGQDFVEDCITIFVVHVQAGQKLSIEFDELEENAVLNVVVTNFTTPTLKDFKEFHYAISNKNDNISEEYTVPFDSFRLIGVLPDRNYNGTIFYVVSAYSAFCVEWDFRNRTWLMSCPGKFIDNRNSLVCYCKHLSTISGTAKYSRIDPQDEYIGIEFVLDENFNSCYIIGLTTGFLVLIYCILISLTFKKYFLLQDVYFLCDIPAYSRFGYLIIVKTGSKMNSSTTSNIVIKLKGTKSKSMANVLNFPDPHGILFQKNNENWFILGCDDHLGPLESLEIWSDLNGTNCSWFCEEIRVYDLQHNLWNYFYLHQWFEVYPVPLFFFKFPALQEHLKQDETSNWKTKTLIKFQDFISKMVPRKQFLFRMSLKFSNESFSYFKRMTVLLSITLSISIWGLFFYGVPEFKPRDAINSVYNYKISYEMIWKGLSASLCAFAYNTPLIVVFRVVLIFNIILMISLLLLWGFRTPQITSWMWLTSVFLGLLFYVLVLETTVSIGTNFILGIDFVSPVRGKVNEALQFIERQRAYLYKIFGKSLLRPYLTHLYEPMSQDKITSRILSENVRRKMAELLENIIMFTLYATLLYSVVLSNRDFLIARSTMEVIDLITGPVTKTQEWDDVNTPAKLLTFFNETLIEATQSRPWYGTYVINNPGMTVDQVNKILGIIRVRQHRWTKNTKCKIAKPMDFLNVSCISPDDVTDEQTKDFAVGWTELHKSGLETRQVNIWKYKTANDTGTSLYYGEIAFYPGGGYVAFFGRSKKNSLINLQYMCQNLWIDKWTKSVFIEFLLYNGDYNMFNAVRMIVEISSAGSIHKDIYVQPTRLILTNDSDKYLVTVFFSLFACFVFFLILVNIYRIYKTKIWYFKDGWRILELIIIIFSIVCIAMFTVRSKEVKILLDNFEKSKHNEFVNYFTTLRHEDIFICVAAVLICTATIKLWRVFRFQTIFKVVEKTFILAFQPFCALILCHMVITLGFGIFAYIIFLETSSSFTGIFVTAKTLILFSLMKFETKHLEAVHLKGSTGYLFFILFTMTVILLSNLYATLIMSCYEEAREIYSDEKEFFTFRQYLSEKYDYYKTKTKIGIKSFRLKGGGKYDIDNIDIVYPKGDEHRYANLATVGNFRLSAMCHVSICVLRNYLNIEENIKVEPMLSPKNLKLVLNTLYYLKRAEMEDTDEEDDEKFYLANVGTSRKIVPDTKIRTVEDSVCRILGLTSREVLIRRHKKSARYKIAMLDIDQLFKKINKDLNSINAALKKMEVLVVNT